ncbi:MAG: DUF423 domain-containing protein [Balneolaceae bacterium]|nr:DUF423 domain-containing protein [Balneolaceae bacterium]MBO6545850.1 DUF423 domain-containing protein [Balneolaceae bacterium]MBO6647246.1 DUF423 domain-containing protein [Balneolaceae bacterium]
MSSPDKILSFAGLLMALAIALGAFGAHAFEDVLSPERLQTWETAVQYQAWNALGIILMVLTGKSFMVDIKASTILLLTGILIFSGSLYVLCLTDLGWFGAITPIGGILFIIGWSLFGWKLLTLKK